MKQTCNGDDLALTVQQLASETWGGGMASATATLTVPGLLVNVPRMRCWLQEVLAGWAVTAEVAFDLSVAVTEVCTNIIRHGYHDRASGDIDIQARKDGDTIRLTIVDTAPRFTPRDLAIPAPQALAEGGYGLLLIHTLVDEVAYEAGGGQGNRTILVKHARARSAPP
jgi:serine/threonine-protein kinase RsbW